MRLQQAWSLPNISLSLYIYICNLFFVCGGEAKYLFGALLSLQRWEEWKTVHEFMQQLTVNSIVPEERMTEVKEKVKVKVNTGEWPKN